MCVVQILETKLQLVPIGRNLSSEHDFLATAGDLAGIIDRSAAGSGCHFFLMQKPAGKIVLVVILSHSAV